MKSILFACALLGVAASATDKQTLLSRYFAVVNGMERQCRTLAVAGQCGMIAGMVVGEMDSSIGDLHKEKAAVLEAIKTGPSGRSVVEKLAAETEADRERMGSNYQMGISGFNDTSNPTCVKAHQAFEMLYSLTSQKVGLMKSLAEAL